MLQNPQNPAAFFNFGNELKKAGITLDPEELRVEGVRWEMEHSGRNGRIAQQFVKWYLGNRKA